MRTKSFLFFIVMLLYSVNITSQSTLDNILFEGQDPSVVYKDGYYYLIQSERKGNIVIRKSSDIAGLKTSRKTEVWPAQCCNVWAPELQFINGRWYIYYTKDDGNNDNHRMYALESSGEDPFGPYNDRGKIADPENDRWAIDGNVIQKEDGSLYFVWSGWKGRRNGQQNIYIAPMSNPYTISGTRVLISEPTHSWERVGMPVNEGPQPIKRNGNYFIVYSASGSWTDDYCLGMLRNTDGNLLNPSSWEKSPNPVFAKAPAAYGPGHHCMVEGPNGECWNIYHANTVSNTGWDGRSIRVQSFSWDQTNVPVFGSPTPTDFRISEFFTPDSIKKIDNVNIVVEPQKAN